MSLAALSHLQLALGSLKQAVEAGGALGEEDRSAVQQIAHELLDLSKPSLGDLPLPHRPSESQIEGGSQEQAIEATEATEEEEPQGFVIPQGLGPLAHHASERSVASQAKLARRHSNLSEASEADSDASDSEAASSGGFSSVFSERSGCETEAAPRRSTSEDGVRRALRVQREVLLSLFHQMDVHNQGVLEANDLERALRSVGQHPARAQKLIAAADENCNGKVEIAEWTHVVDRLVAGKGSEAMQHFTTALVNQNQHLPKAGSSYDERSQQRRVCISCQNPFRMAWDLLLLTLLVYIAVVLPYILAYLNETSFHRFVSDFIDVCFCIDIVLNFCTSYLDEGGDEIDSPKRVAITYLKSWFALDLITAVPLQHLASSIPESMDSIKLLRGSKVFKILKVVRAVKLLKVMRASNLGTRIEDYMMHSSSGRRFFELLRILAARRRPSSEAFACGPLAFEYVVLALTAVTELCAWGIGQKVAGCFGLNLRKPSLHLKHREPQDFYGSPSVRSSKGPISKLQEFVQSSKTHPLPSSCAVLQWSHENRMSGSSLQFRATTSFLLDGVPHHVLGGWWPSKKHSQRDAAERALTFFTAIYGHELGRESTPSARTPCEGSRSDPVKDLEQLVGEAIWSIQAENGLSTATVEFAYFNVPHAFTGKPCAVEAAKADTAKRVLWYLRCPGYQNTYEMEPEQVKTLAFNIPEVCVPPAAGPEPSEDSECCSPTSPSELLERKTTVMRLQNRLQKIFAKQLTSGKSVWCWRYEKNEEDSFQASVHIALLDRTFTGTWESTHQAAQMEACNQLTAYLDKVTLTWGIHRSFICSYREASFLIHPELGRNMVFRGVPARILIRLVSILQQLRVKRNERVVPNPKLAYGMFIILDGSAVLQQISPLPSQRLTSPKDKLTEVLRRSDSFGEEVLLGLKAEYEYTVQATRRLVLLLLPRDSFMERLSPMPEMFTWQDGASYSDRGEELEQHAAIPDAELFSVSFATVSARTAKGRPNTVPSAVAVASAAEAAFASGAGGGRLLEQLEGMAVSLLGQNRFLCFLEGRILEVGRAFQRIVVFQHMWLDVCWWTQLLSGLPVRCPSSPSEPTAPKIPDSIALGPDMDLDALDQLWKTMDPDAEDGEAEEEKKSNVSRISGISAADALAKHRGMMIELFHKLDADKSGVIDAHELRRGLRAVGQHPGRAHRLLQTLDHNQNGKIELSEWIQTIDSMVVREVRSETVESFAKAIVKHSEAGTLTLSMEERKKKVYMLSFRSAVRLSWDMFLTCLLVYIALLLPFRLAFFEDNSAAGATYSLIEVIIDICFIVDILLTFRTTYCDDDGEEINDWKKVAFHYLRSWFLVDFVTAIPLDYMLASADGVKLLKGSKVFKVLKLLRAIKFLKILQATEFGSKLEDVLLLSSVSRFLEGLRILVSCCFLGHLLACLMPILASSFLDRYSYDGEAVSSRYITTLYWAMTTVTTVGYGDITPQNDDERIFTMLSMMVGGAFYGYVVGNISVILASRDVNRQAHKQRLHLIYAWLLHHRFPKPLRQRLWIYYKTLVKNKAALDDSAIFNELSPELRQDVAQYLVPPDLLNHLLFQNVPSSVIVRLVPILQQITAQPTERITSYGSMGSGMFVILDGIAIMDPNAEGTPPRSSRIPEVLRAGDSFGEEVLLGIVKEYAYTVAATSKVVMLFIPADLFMERFANLPEILSLMRKNFTI
ncbi:unnamed protein product [Effrenium voratum]|nr:unnamed protein product [Effrenium voratum]